jgi:hypothetical protein
MATLSLEVTLSQTKLPALLTQMLVFGRIFKVEAQTLFVESTIFRRVFRGLFHPAGAFK